MQLTPHFNLDELCVSQYAARRGISMNPPAHVRVALHKLALNILEPIRKQSGRAVIVTSAYRPPSVNVAIGGSTNSQHCKGEAADFTIARVNCYTACKMIVSMGLPFDQLILEFGQWVHVSHSAAGNQRRQVLTAVRRNGQTVYLPGLVQP